MSYFSLRKRAAETEPEPVEEEQPEETEDDDTEEEPSAGRSPILTGLLGPSAWLTARIGASWSWGLHAVAAWAFGFYGGWIAAGIILAWLLAVLLFVPSEHLDRVTAWFERLAQPPAGSPAIPPPGGEREAVRRLLLDLIGEARGVHLRTVLAHLQQHGQWEGRTVTDMRARLTLLGIPHDRKVKVAGVPTWGVRRADLEAPSPVEETSPSPTPSPTV